jgi:hypothetical protein
VFVFALRRRPANGGVLGAIVAGGAMLAAAVVIAEPGGRRDRP